VIVIGFICEIKEPQESYKAPKTSFDFREDGRHTILFVARQQADARSFHSETVSECLPLQTLCRRPQPPLEGHRRQPTATITSQNPFSHQLSELVTIVNLVPVYVLMRSLLSTCDIVTTSAEKTTFCRTRLAKTLPKWSLSPSFPSSTEEMWTSPASGKPSNVTRSFSQVSCACVSCLKVAGRSC
jgi:hypothetical protein